MSPKQVCLERLREQCSLCGEELEAFDVEVARRINNLEVALRRHFFRPLSPVEAGCLREMVACPPDFCPKFVFSTRVQSKQKSNYHIMHVSFNEHSLQIILLQTTQWRHYLELLLASVIYL